MGATVLADPGEGRRTGVARYAVPALLVAGWGGLLSYSAAFLMDDPPFRAVPAGAAQGAEMHPRPDDGPRRIVVLANPEADATRGPVSAPREQIRPPVAAAALPAPPASPRPPSAPVSAEYVGIWGPTAAACGAPSRRRGYLPATITPERARAGRTTCSFRDGHRAGIAWVMAAECGDRGRRWSSQVRLVVDGDRLTWSSSRGTTTYVRCGRRAG